VATDVATDVGSADGDGHGEGHGEELTVVARLDEIPGIDVRGAQIIVAEVGLDMTRFPTAGQLASWAERTPRTIQSGAKLRGGKTGKGNP
jgi:transposase